MLRGGHYDDARSDVSSSLGCSGRVLRRSLGGDREFIDPVGRDGDTGVPGVRRAGNR